MVEDLADSVLDGSGYTDYIQGEDGEFIGLDHNADGTYTSQPWAPQWMLGYNNGIDGLFHAVSEMDKIKVEFVYDGYRYVVWAWKGDYGQLGAGTEVGFYRQPESFGGGDSHYFAEPWSYNPKTSVSLSLRGEGEIASFAPEDPQFWPAAFNPAYQDVHLAELSSNVSVDFSEAPDGMFDAFQDAVLDLPKKEREKWVLGPNSTAEANFRRKKQGGRGLTLRFRRRDRL